MVHEEGVAVAIIIVKHNDDGSTIRTKVNVLNTVGGDDRVDDGATLEVPYYDSSRRHARVAGIGNCTSSTITYSSSISISSRSISSSSSSSSSSSMISLPDTSMCLFLSMAIADIG